MILNKHEEIALKKFISNKATVSAVKKVLLADIYKVGRVEKDKEIEPRKNWVYGLMMDASGQDYKISNDELGQKVRAVVEGTRALELAFKEMEKLNEEPAVEIDVKNEAR